MNLYEDLMWRGLIKDVAGENIKDILNGSPFSFYWGTDPTAESLHIGHYSSLVTAKRLYMAGHHPILLIGGATGLIGDPRPTAEREIISYETVNKNIAGISAQVSNLFNNEATIVNNYDWLKEFDLITFLREVGKYININYMLDKDIIRRRLETGITFAEFTYTLMQGYDFLHLYETKNCIMQVEGSDQWGNITTGIDLINKKLGKTAYAFTMPLILDNNGNKFGKSEGNALFLDKNITSSYKLYQYLINTDDSKVLEYLKVFTFLSKDEIEEVMSIHSTAPEKRIAQLTLAKCMISDIHGEEEFEKAKRISQSLFSEDITNLKKEEIISSFNGVPKVNVLINANIIDFLVDEKICTSKREAKELVNGNAISINNKKITDENYHLSENDLIDNAILVIKKGKKNYYLGITK